MSEPDTYGMLRNAIINKRQVTCSYQGHYREMCPHVLGHKDGDAQVLSYQFGGQSRSGLPAGGEWRCMKVAEIEDVTVQEGDWYTGHTHTQPQTCVDQVDVEVSY